MNEEDIKLIEKGKLLELKPIISSNITGIGYDKESKLLKVMFRGGSKYLYENVEENLYNIIINSESIGKALSECIVKNKEKYKYFKI